MDVVGFLIDYGIANDPHGQNTGRDWIGVNCPFCGDSGYHGGFSLIHGGWNCWKCTTKHGARSAIKELTGVTWSEVKQILEKYFYGLGIRNKEERVQKYPFFLPGSLDFKKVTYDYIANRNYDVQYLQQKYGLRCGGYDGDYSYRVIIPIYYQGRIVSFQTRALFDYQVPRYKDCSPDYATIYHKRLLYNLDNCKENWCIAMEGVFDVFRWGDNACCTFGTGYTPAQVVMLSDLFDIVFVWYDPGANSAAEKLCADLGVLGTKAINLKVAGADPGDSPRELMHTLKLEIRKYL